jgi:pimeloyl-ACP methyl ester carboxylesterase
MAAAMTKVFVHGVPDTSVVWRPLLDRLRLPDGGAVTLNQQLPRPLDLVAHDWGALLVLRIVSLEPALARSWSGRMSSRRSCGRSGPSFLDGLPRSG